MFKHAGMSNLSHPIGQLALCLLLWTAALAGAQAGDRLRLAVQKTGSLAWELDIIKARGLDKGAQIDLEITELANPEAGKIALRGGSADIMVGDWLWVSRERSMGADFVFFPYSSAIGALMVPADSPILSLTDLRGRKLGVAGGALDKSWLLLRGYAKRHGLDLRTETIVNFASPPLIAEKALQGEMDAALNFWNFSAGLEGSGFKTLLAMQDVEQALGAKGPVAMLGYVFDGEFGRKNADLMSRFFRISREAKEILASSPQEWAHLVPKAIARDEAVLAIYRRKYVEGIPKRSVAEEEEDARTLYRILVETGGASLVGEALELAPGTFYKPASGS